MKKHLLILSLFFCGALNSFSQTLDWISTMTGSDLVIGRKILVDDDGYIYAHGEFAGTVDFDPGPNTFNLTSQGTLRDLFVAKYDSNQNLIWAKSVGNNETNFAYDMVVDDNGNSYITGNFSSAIDIDPGSAINQLVEIGNGKDAYLLKLNSSGDFEWVQHLQDNINLVNPTRLTIDDNNNVYLLGSFKDSIFVLQPSGDIDTLIEVNEYSSFIYKVNPTGEIVWSRLLGGTNGLFLFNMTSDADGLFFSGSFADTIFTYYGVPDTIVGRGLEDAFVQKMDTSGNFKWNYQIGNSSYDYIGGVLKTDGYGDLYVTGYFSETVDFDNGPTTFNLTSPNYEDQFILKLDDMGNFIWVKMIDQYIDINDADFEQPYQPTFIGHFYDTTDFDPGVGEFELYPKSGTGPTNFILRLTDQGDFISVKDIYSTNDVYLNDLVVYNNSTYMIGSFKDTAFVNPYGSDSIFSQGYYDVFMVKFNNVPNTTDVDYELEDDIILYPNPANDFITFNSEDRLITNISVYDINGKKLVVNTLKNTIEISHLSKGIYTIVLQSENESIIKRFIKL